MEGLLRFLMLTGITKILNQSVFSGLNNITDLSMKPWTATMFGYTEEELAVNFSQQMHARAETMRLSDDAFHAELNLWYNGYRFYDKAPSVYNPFVIAGVLAQNMRRLGPMWTQGCHSVLLVERLKCLLALNVDINGGIEVTEDELSRAVTQSTQNPIGLLYQTGYLTIDHFDRAMDCYVLRVPDKEISRDLNGILRDLYDGNRGTNFFDLRRAFINDDMNALMALLKPMYSNLIYGTKEASIHEDNYRRVLHTFFLTNGFVCAAEKRQSNGNRSDLVVEYGDFVYIFEFKNRAAADAGIALEQIADRKYMAPYLTPGRRLRQIGLAFDPKSHELIDWAWRTAGADAGACGKMPDSETATTEA